ncbi:MULTISPECIES: low specificity L-threonine aldolase [unclassified Haloferax]|uniref:threonine aldolase family protein n=1 Tax=unclassified Haloferax TaxID=2625095 RepID=UPI0002B1657C|nr:MULTISPECIES: GntG family PLP-dependent aldolase [unclassified Haloferax]ELZ57882.1 threonine aldolase [Haloferax sp. ATCC BAA-646]ELZ62367.1 threonine aldolase [Haloferax sp. ATCC BAA-645]ELZ64146.1 threonine aldolase [Haloferax sp. ATCC BAA-644]
MIDLRSDTVTLPSDEMREAARDAAVGDDVYGDDPTVNELEARAAELVGKEAALFVPSGTMGNQIAARVHADPGQEALVDEKAHVYKWEVGGFAQLSGLQVRAYDAGERAAPTPAQVRDHAREESLHVAGTGVLCLENTHNARGGVAVPKADIDAAADAARDLGIPVHLDGARLFNACVALDEDPTAMVERVDTVMCCLSKGLGAPVGSMLAGPESFIEEAVRVRKQFGGGMRQAGVIAAPGLVALDNVDRLADDHENATVLAEGLDAVSGLSVPTPDTNIVVVDSEGAGLTAEEFVSLCDDAGVLGGTFGQYHTRFTTNLNVSRADVERAVDLVADAVESR